MAKESKTSLGYVLQKLRGTGVDSVPFGELQKIMREVQRIENIFVSRNLKGKEYEKSGNVGKAKKLYEANVADHFHGRHPYERLRIIYTKEGRYADAIRICEAYMELLNSQEAKAEHRKKVESLKKKTERCCAPKRAQA